MANAQRPVVNQRLYFSRLHIDWLSQQLANEEIAKSVLEQSLGESAVFHLIKTYQAYLAEIATAYTIPLADFSDAKELLGAMEAAEQHSAEALELHELESSASWLKQLQSHYQAIGPINRVVSRPKNNQIVAFSSPESNSTIELETIKRYWQQLSAVIENQRARLEEW